MGEYAAPKMVQAWVHCQQCDQVTFTLIDRLLATGLRYGYGKTKDNPIILNHLFCEEAKKD